MTANLSLPQSSGSNFSFQTGMTDIIRDLICGAAEVAALLLSAAVTCLAAAYAFIWAGPIAGFVVFVIVASLSISAISYFTY